MTLIYWPLSLVVVAVVAGAGGYLARGDCAKEVRATEATATAKAEVTAEQIVSNVRLGDVHITQKFGQIVFAVEALPPETPPPDGCPARDLDAGELRLWNAGNQGGHVAVQPEGTDGEGEGPPAP